MKNNILISTLISLVLCIGLFFYFKTTTPKIGYVSIEDLYNDFQYKKELEVNFKKTQTARKQIMDSLKLELNMLAREIEQNGASKDKRIYFENKKESFLLKEEQFGEDLDNQMAEYKQKIWKQLRQYVKDYSEQNGYESIFGVDENYTILYNHPKKDLTSILKVYINERYKGKSK